MKHPSIKKSKFVGTALLTAAMALPALDFASAESAPEKTLVSFKYLNYSESQTIPGSESNSSSNQTSHQESHGVVPYDLVSGASTASPSGGGGSNGITTDRVKVQAYTVSTVVPVAGKWSIGLNYTYDTVSGASPQYHTSALTNIHDRRNSEDISVTRYFEKSTLTIGQSYSKEVDYIARGYSILGTQSTDDKNTTYSLGASLGTDTINPSITSIPQQSKKTVAGMVGLTKILTQNDIVQYNLGYSHGTGYFSDPYKANDNRPETRNSGTFMTRWNHHFDGSEGTARLSYRFYTDSFGVKAHTLLGEYVQPLDYGWTVAPLLRLYSQNQADFYIPTSSPAELSAPVPPAGQVYSTEDQRLSAFGAMTVGLKISKKLSDDIDFDIKYENYRQRSAWALFGNKDSGLAEFDTNSIQIGLTCLF